MMHLNTSCPRNGGSARAQLRFFVLAIVLIAFLAGMADVASAHVGRRLRVDVADGKLVAQGVNTGAPDGAPETRPYDGAVHDHWRNFNVPTLPEPTFATSFLPEFDLPASVTSLQDHSLSVRLVDAWQWVDPHLAHHGTTTPHFQSLDVGEVIRIDGAANTSTTTDLLGSVLLLESVPVGGDPDIGINYTIDGHPHDEIHVLKIILSATNLNGPTAIAPSDPLYVILAPDGATHAAKLHHEALFLSEFLAALPVPEPTSAGLLSAGAIALAAWRRRQPRSGFLRCDPFQNFRSSPRAPGGPV